MEPVQVAAFPNGEVGIVWPDGHESIWTGAALRRACACARCVDERTGRRVLRDRDVADDVRALQIVPVGRYGVAIRWSDRHDTGIYPFERLRALCPCGCGGPSEDTDAPPGGSSTTRESAP